MSEYEEGLAADLPLARLRWRQACDRLRERFPRVAADGKLASIMASLSDALGDGPQADEPVSTNPDVSAFGRLLSPDMAIAVDGSACIVLVVTEPQGKLLRVVTVADVDAFKAALDDARTAQQVKMSEADAARRTGRDDRATAEGRYTKNLAVAYLARELHVTRGHAVAAVSRAQRYADRGEPERVKAAGLNDDREVLVRYADGWWTIQPATETSDAEQS